MAKRKTTEAEGFIVMWDDGGGLSVPHGHDPDCKGGLTPTSGAVAMFTTRADAQRAIRISVANAKLQDAQGVPANDDYLGASRKNIRIVPLVKSAPAKS